MKSQIISRIGVVSGCVLLALVLALTTPVMAQRGGNGNGSGNGNGPGQGSGSAAASEPLTDAEAAWLTYMREEEKLAGDVYEQLYEKWNLRIFSNISRSEDRHESAVARLMARHGLADPAENLPSGVYASPDLTSMYHELMEKGTRSLEDALAVGVLIEQTDIEDLEEAIAATDKSDLKRVYANLLEGSLNHLQAFESTLEVAGACPAQAD